MKNMLKKLPRWFSIVFMAALGTLAQILIFTAIGNALGMIAAACLRAFLVAFSFFGILLLITELAGIFVSDRLIRQNKPQAAYRTRIISCIAVAIILMMMLVLFVAQPSIPLRILYDSHEIISISSELLASAGLSFLIVTLLAFFVGNVAIKKDSPVLTLALTSGLLLFFCILAALQLLGVLSGLTTLRSMSFTQGILFAFSLTVPFALTPLRISGYTEGALAPKHTSTYSFLEEYKRNNR